MLEAIRRSGIKTKFYQASSSEMFGSAPPLQNEETPFQPQSPYAAAKVYAYWMVRNYREAYHMFAVNGILFNHESPRRGETFVTRKIRGQPPVSNSAYRINFSLAILGRSGTGVTPRNMWRQCGSCFSRKTPKILSLPPVRPTPLRNLSTLLFSHAGIDLEWKGTGIHEKGIVRSLTSSLTSTSTSTLNDGDVLVEIDPRYFRPTEVGFLQGDATKARKKLGWEPKVKFKELARMMVDADIKDLEEMKHCQDVIRKLSGNKCKQ